MSSLLTRSLFVLRASSSSAESGAGGAGSGPGSGDGLGGRLRSKSCWFEGPANPVASRGEEAGPSNQPLPVEAYPYTDTEVIGGDSVSAIQLRLLEKDPSPSAAIIGGARLEAQDLFEVKVEIIKLMAGLDPQGDWMGRGALALENPRTATGEESLGKLYSLLGDLQRDGVQSATYSQLKGKVFLRMDPDEHSSA